MNKITLKIDGMMCNMCEAHVCETIRKVCGEKAKVSASHKTGEAQIIVDAAPDIESITAAVGETGYKVLDVKTEPYEKKRFSLFGK